MNIQEAAADWQNERGTMATSKTTKMEFGYYRPMKAKGVETDEVKAKIGQAKRYWELKRDGHRLLASHDRCWSYEGREAQYPWLQRLIPPGMLLDGELLGPRGTKSHDITHLRSEESPELWFESWDLNFLNGKDLFGYPQIERRSLLIDRTKDLVNDRFKISDGRFITIDSAIEWAAENDCEGVVGKLTAGIISPGSRAYWWKWKFSDNYDAVIVDCDGKPGSIWRVRPGERGTDGKLYPDGLHTQPYLDGKRFSLRYGFYDLHGKLRVCGTIGAGGTKEELQPHVGKVAIVHAYGQYPDTGALRHPGIEGWREPHDKAPKSCVFNFGEKE